MNETPRAGKIWGLSIASLVICAIAFIGIIAAFISLGSFENDIAKNGIEAYGSYKLTINSLGVSVTQLPADMQAILNNPAHSEATNVMLMCLAMVKPILIAGIIVCAIPTVAALICVINARKPEKLSLVMGCSIVGAIASFFCANLITMVLFIIAAVMSSGDKKAYRQNLAFQQAAYNAQHAQHAQHVQMPPQ